MLKYWRIIMTKIDYAFDSSGHVYAVGDEEVTKQKLFNKLWETFRLTKIDFEEIVIGDEEETEVYFKFKNVKGSD